MEQEIWKDVVGYEGLYRVSNLGRFFSLKDNSIMSLYDDRRGYLKVFLIKDSKMKTKKVHRLVAQAFIHNEENKPCIDHIDGNTKNNAVSNLRWCTYKENSNFPLVRKKLSKASKGRKHTEETKKKLSIIKGKQILQFSKDGNFIKEWPSIKSAEKELSISHIIDCLYNRRKTSGGFVWVYKNTRH